MSTDCKSGKAKVAIQDEEDVAKGVVEMAIAGEECFVEAAWRSVDDDSRATDSGDGAGEYLRVRVDGVGGPRMANDETRIGSRIPVLLMRLWMVLLGT